MSQKFPVNGLKWGENTSQFNEPFKKRYTEKSDEGCFFEDDVTYSEILHGIYDDVLFFPE